MTPSGLPKGRQQSCGGLLTNAYPPVKTCKDPGHRRPTTGGLEISVGAKKAQDAFVGAWWIDTDGRDSTGRARLSFDRASAQLMT